MRTDKTPSTKRPRVEQNSPDEAMVVMSPEPKFLHDAFLTSMDSQSRSRSNGEQSSANLYGCRDIRTRCDDHFKNDGIDWTPKHFESQKIFRFGNDLTTRCMTATVIPKTLLEELDNCV